MNQYSNLFVISIFPLNGFESESKQRVHTLRGVRVLLKSLSAGKACFFPWRLSAAFPCPVSSADDACVYILARSLLFQ